MNSKIIFIVSIFLLSCVEKPTDNQLLDLGSSVTFTQMKNFSTQIQILPSRIDVTDSVNYGISNWTMFDDEFEITIEPIYDRIDTIGVDLNGRPLLDTVYSIHRFYDVFLENTKEVSFEGIDSLSVLFEVEVINSNNFYTNNRVLFPFISQIQYQGIGADNAYRNLFNINDLLFTGIKFKFRIHLQLSSGINFQDLITPFQFNRATYRVRFRINGFFKF